METLPEFRTTHLFKGSLAQLWDAWTKPELVAQWFGPKGCTCEVLKHELKPGGIVHSRMTFPGAPAMYGKFTFTGIVPKKQLTWLHSFSDAGGVNLTRHPMAPLWPLELITTVTFTEKDGGTEVTVTWVPNNASAEEIAVFSAAIPGMQMGWGGSFEQLDALLPTLK